MKIKYLLSGRLFSDIKHFRKLIDSWPDNIKFPDVVEDIKNININDTVLTVGYIGQSAELIKNHNPNKVFILDNSIFPLKGTSHFRLLNGKIISTNNKKLISFQFDKIDYDLSRFTSKTITVPKIQELPSLSIIKCSFNMMTNRSYQDKMFDCNIEKLKNLNNELYKRFIKPLYIPLLTLICCFLIIFSKEQNDYTLKTIKIFISVFLILVISETLMRYVDDSFIYLFFLTSIPIIFYVIGYIFLIKKVRYG